ncbi:Sensor protein FixL [bacterium HR25]|mgnify:CR=1 FL=1|jgi:PAS domain S-box-containing protein|nr:Sensor protein FixL [bacterium HR25]
MSDEPLWQGLAERILAEAGDAIILADREGVIRLWNRRAEEVFGYAAGEALGQTLDIIIPERLRERHWEGYRRVMATGESRYGPGQLLSVPAQRQDGSRISVEFTITLLKGEDGRVLGVAAILRDVTERWQRERELRERLSELEARLGAAGQP